MMARRAILAWLLAVLTAVGLDGCTAPRVPPTPAAAREVSFSEFQKLNQAPQESYAFWGWDYTGSDADFHYFAQSLSGNGAIKVKRDDLDVPSPFPLTSDSHKWRQLRWAWPALITIPDVRQIPVTFLRNFVAQDKRGHYPASFVHSQDRQAFLAALNGALAPDLDRAKYRREHVRSQRGETCLDRWAEDMERNARRSDDGLPLILYASNGTFGQPWTRFDARGMNMNGGWLIVNAQADHALYYPGNGQAGDCYVLSLPAADGKKR